MVTSPPGRAGRAFASVGPVAVIGLGTFGGTVARDLASFGHHVVGIDVDEARVNEFADDLAQALIADARDERALRDAGVDQCDAVVVAMGEDLEANIVGAMNARVLGVRQVWVKSRSRTHRRILAKIGVDHVVNPERDMGHRVAQTIHNPFVADYMVAAGNQTVVQPQRARAPGRTDPAEHRLPRQPRDRMSGAAPRGNAAPHERRPGRRRGGRAAAAGTPAGSATLRRAPVRVARRRPGRDGATAGRARRPGPSLDDIPDADVPDADALGPDPSGRRLLPTLRSRGGVRGSLRLIGQRIVRLPPPLTLLVLYAGLVALGTVLLKLPIALEDPVRFPVTWGDAVFMSASAVTVTGLAVVDPATTFAPFGEVVIALLIQLGGLGLMAFAVLVLTALGLPIGLPRSITLREDLGQTGLRDLGRLVRLIAVVFVLCETLGAIALAFVFVPDLGWGQGSWYAVFFAVSAFNNAGFALFSDSLTTYALDPIVNVVVPLLFIVGGLGFAVIADLWRHRRGWRRGWWPRWGPLTLHSKLMLVGTAALIAFAVSAFAALEWSNPATLGLHERWCEKMIVAWFQGVTPRTAGFNTADFGAVHDATALMTVTLMLVGGGATSTAGGIKVTTFICLLLATLAFFRRSTELTAFGRSIPLEDVLRVTALTSIALLFVAVATFLVLISHDGDFLDLVFEITSAFGTVGLSRGATGELDALGRTLVIVLMFAGRVGPLTLGFFLATRTRPRVRYPKGPVFLG